MENAKFFTSFSDLKWGVKDSIWWRDLMLLEEGISPANNLFALALRPILRNGKSMSFWKHCWLDSKPLKLIFFQICLCWLHSKKVTWIHMGLGVMVYGNGICLGSMS